jgi:hypothetical protein
MPDENIITPQDMRRRMQEMASTGLALDGRPEPNFTAPAVRQCLLTGRYNGLSGEDTYTMLAWHLLQMAERYGRIVYELAVTARPQSFVIDPQQPE